MKKMIIAAAILGAMGFASSASAAVASHVFSWTGSVPAASTQNGWIIKTPQKTDIGAGIMSFAVDASGKGVLNNSSDLAFNVFDYASGTPDAAATNYTYQLTSLAVNNNGLAQEQGANGYFEIKADGAALVKDAVMTKATGGDTTLTVAPTAVATPSNQPAAGDDVNVQATIVVVSAA